MPGRRPEWGADAGGDGRGEAARQRLDELVVEAAGLVRELEPEMPGRNLPAMLAVVRLLGFVEGVTLAGGDLGSGGEAALLEVSRLAAALAERTRHPERRRSGRRDGLDRRLGERRAGDRRLIVLPVARERRHLPDRRNGERRSGERRMPGERRAL